MAYVTQYEVDMANQRRMDQAGQQFATGLGMISEENRRRALETKRAQEAQGAQDMAFVKEGVDQESIDAFNKGDKSGITKFYANLNQSKRDEAARAKLLSDRVAESTIKANENKIEEAGKSFGESKEGQKFYAEAALKRELADKELAAKSSEKSVKGSVAEQAVDRGFAQTYDDFIVGGGYSKVGKSLSSLKDISTQLGSYDQNKNFVEGKSNLTGGILGRMPDLLTPNKAIEAREQIGATIQDSLKAILGSSYTEGEGERVIRRAYDPTLSEEANKKRLDATIAQMEEAARAKIQAAKYYETYGTLKGYKGTIVNSVDDIFKSSSQTAGHSQNQVPPVIQQKIQQYTPDQKAQRLQQLRAKKAGVAMVGQ